MIVVSDSSPLIALARIRQLDLLHALYGRIAVSAEVHHEVVVAGHGLPGAAEVRAARWIEVSTVSFPTDPPLQEACAGLGAGERTTILLAKALSADLILMDEWKARRVAQNAGLAVAGCVAVLEAAVRTGQLADLRAAYADLLRHGVRFDIRVLQASLARHGLPPL